MTIKDPFAEYIVSDVLGHIPGISAKAMFGGYGIYQDGLVFAIIADDKLWFKVDETNKTDYQTAKSKPFTYKGHNDKVYEMSYWELPPEVLENHSEIAEWVVKSVNVARASKLKKKK